MKKNIVWHLKTKKHGIYKCVEYIFTFCKISIVTCGLKHVEWRISGKWGWN